MRERPPSVDELESDCLSGADLHRVNEVDLRRILDDSIALRPDIEAGRWIVATRHLDQRWEVILEPDKSVGVVLVVTAYPASTSQP